MAKNQGRRKGRKAKDAHAAPAANADPATAENEEALVHKIYNERESKGMK